MGFARAPPRVARCVSHTRGKGRTSWHPVPPLLLLSLQKELHAINSAFIGGKISNQRGFIAFALYAPFFGNLLVFFEILL